MARWWVLLVTARGQSVLGCICSPAPRPWGLPHPCSSTDPMSTWDRAPTGSHLATCLAVHHPVGWGHRPWCSPRSPQPRWVCVCLFIFVLTQIYFIYGLETFQPKRAKKLGKIGCPCPNPLWHRVGSICLPCPLFAPQPWARSHSPPFGGRGPREVHRGVQWRKGWGPCLAGAGVQAGAGARPPQCWAPPYVL